MIQIPYGNANFEGIRKEGLIYVDKTKYIELLEQGDDRKKVIYLRPRRFGKSLFTSMLTSYYSVDRKDQFGWHFKGCFGGPYNGKFIAEIDECPLQQEQPSLPSNLDEAEFEYVQSLDEIPANQEEENMIYDAFKAGAKWMAKQGVSIPAHIFMPCEIKDVYDSSKGEYPAAIHPDCGGSLVLERYLKDFKHNEEVIMQIRKKEE